MQDIDIITKLRDSGFYEVYRFFKEKGIWTTTVPYGAMAEVYALLTRDHKHPNGQRMRTDCQGCIEKAGDLIFKHYPNDNI